jgi:hypothetical protein
MLANKAARILNSVLRGPSDIGDRRALDGRDDGMPTGNTAPNKQLFAMNTIIGK